VEDEEPTEIDDVVVVGRRAGTGDYFISIPVSSGNGTFIISQQVVDQYISDSGSTTAPDSQERFEEIGVFVLTELLKYMKHLPGLTPQELQELDRIIERFQQASNLYALGQIDREEFKNTVQDGLELLFEQVGDYLGSAVTGAIVGAAASVGFAPTSVGGLAAGAFGIAVGAAVAQAFPDEALAAGITDLLFGDSETINRIENHLQEQIENRAFDFYQEFLDYIFRNFPEDAPRPYAERGMTVGTEENGVVVYAGTIGRDNISFANAAAAVSVDMSIDAAQNSGGAGQVRLLTIDGVFGSQFNDTLLGNAMDNLFAGAGGNDYLDGRDGFDFADYRLAVAGVTVNLGLTVQNTGGAGVDTLIDFEGVIGSAHNDVLIGDAGNNTLYGLAGDDTLQGGDGDDLLVGGSDLNGGINVLDGGSGFDTVSYEHETRNIWVGLADGMQAFYAADGMTLIPADSLFGIEGVMLGTGNDTGSGSAGDDRIFGNDGSDLLSGGDGDDLLEGGAGNDTLNGGAGFDTLSYAAAAGGVTVNLNAVQPDWWWAGWANIHSGGAGTDQVFDHFEGLLGSTHNDTLIGNFLDNDIRGSVGNDRLEGMAGNDRLFGGEGQDTMLGGAGADRFVFERFDDSPVSLPDVILDFEVGSDLLDLSALDVTGQQVTFSLTAGSTFVGIDRNADGVMDLMIELRGTTGSLGLGSTILE